MMRIKPSDVMFSQESVNNFFDKRSRHSGILIGETLDDICEGRCNIDDIPTIRVMKRGGNWVTADNRRLWVFRELERLGKCNTIPVNETYYIPPEKLNSENGGVSVRVRRHAGGHWHNKRSAPHLGPKTATHLGPNTDTNRTITKNIKSYNSTPFASNTSASCVLENAYPKPSMAKASSAYATRASYASHTEVPSRVSPVRASIERHIPRGTTFSDSVDRKSASSSQNFVVHGFKESTTMETNQNRGQNPFRPIYSGYVTNPSFNSAHSSYVDARQNRNDAIYPYSATDDKFLSRQSGEKRADSNFGRDAGQSFGKNRDGCVDHVERQSHSTRQDRAGAARVYLYDDGVVSRSSEQCPCSIL